MIRATYNGVGEPSSSTSAPATQTTGRTNTETGTNGAHALSVSGFALIAAGALAVLLL